MKKFLAIILSVLTLTASAVSVSARGNVTLKLNGEVFNADTEPFIENNRTYVPVRAVFEAVGASVMWDNEKGAAIIARKCDGGMIHIAVQRNLDYVFINSERAAIDAPAFIENNRMYVPLAVIMRALGEEVVWDNATRTVNITAE